MSNETPNPTPAERALLEAQRVREAAKRTNDPREREILLGLAAAWQRLADPDDWFEGI